MISDKGFEIQKQIREKSNELRETMMDLQSWEQEIKMKEKLQKSEQNPIEEITEIRTKYNKPQNKPVIKEAVVEMQPNNYEEAAINEENDEINKKLADEEKEKGNNFVKTRDYEKALEHYSNAIRIYNKESVYYSNRAFCYLKLEKFTESVADCTKAINLVETDASNQIIIKSLYRRMLAYESLKKFDKALQDCTKLKNLEPNKNIYLTNFQRLTTLVNENRFNLNKLETTDFIMKPPNQRSKKPLRRISITEIEADVAANSQTDTKMSENAKIPDEVLDTLFNNATGAGSAPNYSMYGRNYNKKRLSSDDTNKPGPSSKIKETKEVKSTVVPSAVTAKTVSEIDINIDCANIKIPKVPNSGSQFEIAWRELSIPQKYLYLKELATVKNLRKIFESSLTSEILSELLLIMKEYFTKNGLDVYHYLKEISCCSEISILAMMMSAEDKANLNQLFSFIKDQNKYANEINVIKKSFIG